MKSIDFEKYKFKLRSLPNFKTASRYVDYYLLFIAVLGAYNLFYICLFANDFIPTLPAPFLIAIPVIFVHVYSSIESEYLNVDRECMKEVVVHIRLKQLQSLKEKLEENPEILSGKYENRSLLYWAKHYKNLQANAIIIENMKKMKKLS